MSLPVHERLLTS